MKVAHYFDELHDTRGGTYRALVDWCGLYAARRHSVEVVTYDARDVPPAWEDGAGNAPEVVELPVPRLPGGIYDPFQMRAVRRSLPEAEIVHLHNLWRPSTPQIAAVCRERGVPYVLTLHGLLDDWSMRQSRTKKLAFLYLAGRRVLEDAAAIHATAEAEREQAEKWLSEGARDRVEVLPYPFDVGLFRDLPGPALARTCFSLEDGPLDVLFLSRLHPKKRPDVAIRSLRLLLDDGHDVRLLVAGDGADGYVEKLEGLAAELGLGDRCRFLGFVRGQTKLSLYQHADVFVLPTSQENFGLVYVEALAAGTPVVGTRGTDIWKELADSGGGLIVDQLPGPIAGAVAELLDAPARRERMGEEGRRWVLHTFDADRLSSQTTAMYERALRRAVSP